jgi:hypothetical protein
MAGIRPESGRNPAILAGFGQTCSPGSGNGDRKLPDSGDSCSFSFCNFFFARIKRQKKIFENDFIENILPLKPFYVKTNGILKRRH